MAKTSEFGKEVKIRLVEMEKNQAWLIEQVKEKTGLYFDDSYLWKINTGLIATPSIVTAIRDILGMSAEWWTNGVSYPRNTEGIA